MIIALPYENEMIFQHFGKTQEFCFYNTETKTTTVESTNGAGHSALVGYLKDHNADVLICGGIGQGAVNALNDAGIQIYAGNSTTCKEALEAFLNNELSLNSNASCDHHHGNHECK